MRRRCAPLRSRRPMSDEVAQQYLNAWAALTSPDPTVARGFAREHPQASRWLKLAMQLMTRRFPDKRNGLSYWDHALLSPSEGARTRSLAHHRLHHGRDLRTGRSRRRLVSVRPPAAARGAGNPKPLLTLSGDQTSIRHTEAALTPFGEEVLKGAASNYPANPIDDWAAGVRLSSATASCGSTMEESSCERLNGPRDVWKTCCS